MFERVAQLKMAQQIRSHFHTHRALYSTGGVCFLAGVTGTLAVTRRPGVSATIDGNDNLFVGKAKHVTIITPLETSRQKQAL